MEKYNNFLHQFINFVFMTIVATNGRKWGIMVIDYKKVGLKIKEVRLKKNLSQECLAEKCNLSSAYISYVEQGKKKLSLKSIISIASSLGVTVDLLLGDEAKNNNYLDLTINNIIKDCNTQEKQIIYDVASSTKNSLRRNIFNQ